MITQQDFDDWDDPEAVVEEQVRVEAVFAGGSGDRRGQGPCAGPGASSTGPATCTRRSSTTGW